MREESLITKEFAIKKLAEGAADPRCKKCSGKGTRGRINGTILICKCAVKGFRYIKDGHVPITCH